MRGEVALLVTAAVAMTLAPRLAAAQAESPPVASSGTVRLTLGEALERSRSASASLAQLRALATAAQAQNRSVRAARLPQVDVLAGYTRQSDVPELVLALPGQPPRTIFPNIPDNYRSRLEAAVPVYTGGRLGAQVEAAAREEEAAGHDVLSGSADLGLETSRAYWSLVTARESERVLEEALSAYDAHLTDARNRERFGLAARNEVLAIQVERDRAELGSLRAGNAADVAEANLLRLTGLPPGTHVDTAEPLAGAPAPPEEREALVAAALSRRPERAALAARVAAAQARVRIERSARLPQVSASAGLDYANPNRRLLPPEARWQESWDVSVNVGWRLFDGGRAAAAAEAASARAEALRRQLEDVDGRIRLEVTQRHLELATAGRAVDVAERNVTSARENLRVAVERHQAGVIPSSERLDAEVALMRATLDRTEALAQLRLALAALDRATGR